MQDNAEATIANKPQDEFGAEVQYMKGVFEQAHERLKDEIKERVENLNGPLSMTVTPELNHEDWTFLTANAIQFGMTLDAAVADAVMKGLDVDRKAYQERLHSLNTNEVAE
jgi:hypothetical protein